MHVADHRSVVGLDVGADVAPPRYHRAGAAEELDERGLVRIGVELVGRLGRQRVDDVLDGAHPGRVVDERLHGFRIEQPGLVVGVLGVGGGAAAEEVEAEAAPGLRRVEIAERVLAVDLLALEELGDGLNLLPGLGHAPFALSALRLPCFRRARRRKRRRCGSRKCGSRRRSTGDRSCRPRCRPAPSGSRHNRPSRPAWRPSPALRMPGPCRRRRPRTARPSR